MTTINQTSSGGIVYKTDINKPGVNNYLWLIGKHSAHKGWVFLKGLVGDKDDHESMEVAAIREVKEEGGITAKIVNPTPVKVEYAYRQDNDMIHKTVYYYLMDYVSGDPKDHDWEMEEVKFVTKEELLTTLSYPSDIQAFNQIWKLLNQLGK